MGWPKSSVRFFLYDAYSLAWLSLTSFKTIQKTIENQVLIAENIIIGDIPSTYYNFEGTNSEQEALRLIE